MDFNRTFSKYQKSTSINIGEPHKIPNKKHYNCSIIIPCYNEFNYVFNTLDSISAQDQILLNETLVIIVINNSSNDNEKIKNNNFQTYNLLLKKQYNFEFIAIDCFSNKFALNPRNSGVGYARKTGLDFCLRYIKNQYSLLCSLDADTLISSDYINVVNKIFTGKTTGACVLNFRHQKSHDSIIEKGIRKYEKKIKYIAKKIHESGSPYGYVSMGSTIVCNAESYVACGGMSKKKATEDFYFLQSLAKYTQIHQAKECIVFPSSRDEQRVYLGTGYRIQEYKESGAFKGLTFSDESFSILNNTIKIIIKSYTMSWKQFDKVLLSKLQVQASNFLKSKNIDTIWEQINTNAKTQAQFNLFFHQWFDALMVMQFLKKIN